LQKPLFGTRLSRQRARAAAAHAIATNRVKVEEE
jgi:hypothetical protein